MKLNGTSSLAIATASLILVSIFAAMNFDFGWVFFMMLIGQGITLFAVYKVLTDDYHTDKEFKDFYEDRPDLGK